MYHDESFPGPAKYDYLKPMNKDSIKWKIGDPPKPRENKKEQPQPGFYENPLQIKQSGKYIMSKVKNTTNIIKKFQMIYLWI